MPHKRHKAQPADPFADPFGFGSMYGHPASSNPPRRKRSSSQDNSDPLQNSMKMVVGLAELGFVAGMTESMLSLFHR